MSYVEKMKMDLIIMSFDEINALEDKKTYNLISILSDADEQILKSRGENVSEIRSKFKECLALSFEDVLTHETGLKCPNAIDVITSINWSRTRNRIIVQCFGGISRSSAIAFLIAIDKYGLGSAKQLIKGSKNYQPNLAIIKYGERIFSTELIEWVYVDR